MTPDGLRGIAAWFVVLHHSSLLWFSWDVHSAWRGGFAENGWLVKLPMIRLMIAGPPQVVIFFIVSGYAISHKPLKLARQGRFTELGATLSSSVFRRHPRLFMPAAFITLCNALMTQFDGTWYGGNGLPGVAVPTRIPPHALNMMDQLMHFRDTEIQATNPIYQGLAQGADPRVFNNPYDPNLWTLPMEFSSSFVVFTFITAFSRIRNRIRMAFALAVTLYFEYYFVYWAIIPFLCGMFICDLHFEIEEVKDKLSAENPDLPMWARVRQHSVSRFVTRVTRSLVLRRILGISAFFLSIWLLSTPQASLGGREAWGYVTLTSWVSDMYRDHVLVVLGAALLVLTVDQATFLQVLFTNPFSQYMGRISYSLYLVHGPLLWSLGLKLGHFGLGLTGREDNFRYTMGILIAACLWWPVAIYASDLTARFVDEVCVRFARWIYGKLLKKEE